MLQPDETGSDWLSLVGAVFFQPGKYCYSSTQVFPLVNLASHEIIGGKVDHLGTNYWQGRI